VVVVQIYIIRIENGTPIWGALYKLSLFGSGRYSEVVVNSGLTVNYFWPDEAGQRAKTPLHTLKRSILAKNFLVRFQNRNFELKNFFEKSLFLKGFLMTNA
jgi:hypothetical protein